MSAGILLLLAAAAIALSSQRRGSGPAAPSAPAAGSAADALARAFGGAASGAVGFTPSGTPSPGANALPLDTIAEPANRNAYIDALYQRQLVFLPVAKGVYNIDRLRAIALAASVFYGVPPEWTWGLLKRESNMVPVGIFGASPAKAKKAKSTAYGVSQILRGRFDNSEKKWLRETGATWNHSDLIDPKRAIWTTAASLGRGLYTRGGGRGRPLGAQQAAIAKMAKEKQGLAVGRWWAGQSEAATKGAIAKVKDIIKWGPDVWNVGPPANSYMWQKTGPVSMADWLPPWLMGEASEGDKAATLVQALNLSVAGQALPSPAGVA